MENSKVTIIDVARRAGVSKGTVDRVLHDRGEVSKRSAEKVRKAIAELNYEPNLYASLLATKKARTIACILPSYEEGAYWEKIYNGAIKGGEQVASLNVGVSVHLYNQYDSADFRRACDEALDEEPSAVMLPPLFMNDTIEFTAQLHAKGIPYAYVDSRLEDPSYFAYFGMPMYKSGFLCAHLLTDRLSAEARKEIVIVRINRDKNRQSDPTVNRRAGFMDYIDQNYPETVVYNVFIDPSDPEAIYSTMEAFFAEHPSVKNIVMFNSRIHLLSDFLARHPAEHRIVIGYDDLASNMEMLRNGLVDILISQHSEEQASQAITLLTDYILLHKMPSERDNYMHMDILMRYNLENY